MSADNRRRGLGRGLSALLGEGGAPVALAERGGPQTVPIEFLRPSRVQPRRRFDQAELEALAGSIAEKGVLQPLVVRRHPDGDGYEIVAGERRWRAAQIAQLHEVPVVVRELSDRDALEVALVENLQRQDLAPLEEAEAYRRLIDEFDYNSAELGRVIGKSRAHVANMLRLLELPREVAAMLEEGKLTAGHARALLTAADPVGLARLVFERGLNVRETEELARKGPPRPQRRSAAGKDPNIAALELTLAANLGLKVSIAPRGAGGELKIRYGSLDQLDDLMRRLG